MFFIANDTKNIFNQEYNGQNNFISFFIFIYQNFNMNMNIIMAIAIKVNIVINDKRISKMERKKEKKSKRN